MMEGLLSRLGASGMDPEKMVPLLFRALPEHRQRLASELGSFLGEVRTIGPPDPPSSLRSLFRRHGEAEGVSPELLAGVSWALSRFTPDYREGGRVGLLGIPDTFIKRGTAEMYLASFGELERGLPKAAERLGRGVAWGASSLASMALEDDSMASALRRWIRAGALPAELEGPEPRRLLWEVASTSLLYTLRSMGGGNGEAS